MRRWVETFELDKLAMEALYEILGVHPEHTPLTDSELQEIYQAGLTDVHTQDNR